MGLESHKIREQKWDIFLQNPIIACPKPTKMMHAESLYSDNHLSPTHNQDIRELKGLGHRYPRRLYGFIYVRS